MCSPGVGGSDPSEVLGPYLDAADLLRALAHDQGVEDQRPVGSRTAPNDVKLGALVQTEAFLLVVQRVLARELLPENQSLSQCEVAPV